MKHKWQLAAAVVIVTVAAVYVLTEFGIGGRGVEKPEPAARAATVTAPATGRFTMIDLGATECVPCKMMAPIIEELKKEYQGRADIIFIDVWKDPAPAKKYGIRAIPTQIFFDAEGREVHRNVGFMDKKRIVDVLTRLGVS
jgi:thioredoxin 1